jgi:hypothetical protein
MNAGDGLGRLGTLQFALPTLYPSCGVAFIAPRAQAGLRGALARSVAWNVPVAFPL